MRVIYTSKGMSKKFGVRVIHYVRVIYRKIRHAHYLYIKRNVEKVWGARYTLGARYLSKNTVVSQLLHIIILISLGGHKFLPTHTKFVALEQRSVLK